ncbi:MAG: c-type cytochrome [Planctomycetes bacterium]|nr:c-type cytochrome [Planctomycetota bacterium]
MSLRNPRLLFGLVLSVAALVWAATRRAGYAEPAGTEAAPDGKALYARHCANCHGEKGDGRGPAAVYLYPKPRDFTGGQFKVRSTQTGQMPTDQDLFDTLGRGMPGTAMPAFAFLQDDERRALVAEVKALATRTDAATGQAVNLFVKRGPGHVVEVGPEPAKTPATVTLGRTLYAQMECAKCHGATGRGDGPSSAGQKDVWGYPIRVRDFTSGVYIGGNTDRDLYLRFTTGLNGTPMPSYVDDMSNDERWALVHFVQSLRRPDAETARLPKDGLLVAGRANGAIPAGDPSSALWGAATTYEVPLFRLFQGRDPEIVARVQALAGEREVALRMSWKDPSYELTALTSDSFRDSAAVEFGLTKNPPYLGMGSKDAPVNLWQWKADWQSDLSFAQGVSEAYPDAVVDTYHFPDAVLDQQFQPGRAAGNPVSQRFRRSAVEDLNAAGFGTLTPQPPGAQNVDGRATWDDGWWTVVFVRPLATQDAGDVDFGRDDDVPVAFAVWGGAQRDRNGQKAFSTWYRLRVRGETK